MSRFEAQQVSEGRGRFISALALAAAFSWGVISLFTVNTDRIGTKLARMMLMKGCQTRMYLTLTECATLAQSTDKA